MTLYEPSLEQKLYEMLQKVNRDLPKNLADISLHDIILKARADIGNNPISEDLSELASYVENLFTNRNILHYPENFIFLSELLMAGESKGFNWQRLEENDRLWCTTKDNIIESYLKENAEMRISDCSTLRGARLYSLADHIESLRQLRFFPTYFGFNEAEPENTVNFVIMQDKRLSGTVNDLKLIVYYPGKNKVHREFDASLMYISEERPGMKEITDLFD